LILDDLGYVQQSREEMEVLFTLLAERYERGSVLITSNLPFSRWESIFKDAMTTAAVIDRLVHHSVILELNLPSYRVEQAKKSKAAVPIEVPPPRRRDQKEPGVPVRWVCCSCLAALDKNSTPGRMNPMVVADSNCR